MMSTLASSADQQDCICRETDGTKELTFTPEAFGRIITSGGL